MIFKYSGNKIKPAILEKLNDIILKLENIKEKNLDDSFNLKLEKERNLLEYMAESINPFDVYELSLDELIKFNLINE